jgi:alcohol dehydrogenase (cytochrome c)
MGGCQRYDENKCFISAYDPATGEQRWRFVTIALEGEPGGDSWGPLPNLYRAGGETWITGSYDPDLNLTYWGVAQAKPWMPASRGMGSRDVGLYTNSTVALDASTGKLKWHYAHAPGETLDLDVVFERVLVDAGNEKWVFSAGKDGVLWKHDRRRANTLATRKRCSRTCGRASIVRQARPCTAPTSSTRKLATGSTAVRARKAARIGKR